MPNPVITLVFTDVVGSSAAKRATTLGADVDARDRAYLDAIQTEHLRVVRSAVEKYRGKEMMTMGDSFFLTFDDPVDAVRCAAAIHQRLRTHPIDTPSGPLRLRIGLHAGTPKFFENSWHGTDVDIAARAQGAAGPEQIVVTDAVRQLVGDPVGITLRPLGTFALKGVGDVKLWDADYDQRGKRPAALRSRETRRLVQVLAIGISACSILASAIPAGLDYWHSHAQAPASKQPLEVNSIIVANIENKTGEPVFDSLLTPAFTLQLQQSPVLTIASAEHLRQSMQYLGKSADAPLTADDARQIGVREGIKAYLTGTINKLGDIYVINATATNTSNGDTIASAEAQAADKDHVLEALSTVSTTMRNQLGESLDSIQKLDTPLGQATTPSLEAFRAFALGDVDHDKNLEIPEAEGHYKQALEIDPNFAMAWLRLGAVYFSVGRQGKAMECFTRAFQLSKNVSERERLHIAGLYYYSVTGDLQKAIDTLDLATRTYPLDKGFFVNLAIAQSALGQLEPALVNMHKAVALAPDSTLSNSDLLGDLIQLDKFPEALQVVTQLKKLGVNDSTDIANLYDFHFLTGDEAAMAQDSAIVHGRTDEFDLTGTVAGCSEFSGRYRDADKDWKRAVLQCGTAKATDTEAADILFRAQGRAVAGLPVDAAAEIKAALALDQSKPTLLTALFLAGICNLPDVAQPLAAQLAHDYPDDTLVNQVVLPLAKAALALEARQPQAALDALQQSETFDFLYPTAYLRGLAYLELKDGTNAVAAFQRATTYRGSVLNSSCVMYAQAQLGLARAYVLTGDKAAATKAYEAFFTTWKNADTDLPQLVVAKKEYGALTTIQP